METLETDRLLLRPLTPEDAPFILGLLNEPSWLQYIGDRGVRTLDDACGYILKGPVEMYERHGHGLLLTELKQDPEATKVPIGLCGLIKRDALDDVDIGFAFLPRFWSQGYACEAAAAVLEHGKSALGLRRVVAITVAENASSIRLLEKLGFRFERLLKMAGDDEELKLFGRNDP